MKAARPTLRCLREDLKVPLPPVNRPLDEVAHPLLHKANEQFANESGGRERTDTRAAALLPDGDDRVRYRLEALVPALVRDSLRDGREHRVDLDTFGISIHVRADRGHETCVAIGAAATAARSQ